MSNIKISVIIPTYNEANVIVDCLKSLGKQTVKDFEVIIVDDGSTDDTLEKIESITYHVSRITVLQQKHCGPGAARNLGAKSAKGKVLIFVDADMTFSRNFLKELVKPIQKGKTKGTFSKEEYVSNWENVWARCWNINEGWLPMRRHAGERMSIFNKMYNRLAFIFNNRSLSLKEFEKEMEFKEINVFRAIIKSEFDRVGGFTPGGYTDDYTLSKKLKYGAYNVRSARFYHKNPGSLVEIYKHAKWVGKRKYKLGVIGYFFTLFKSSFPVSIAVGLYKSLTNFNLAFVVFKIIYDFGLSVGILEYLVKGKSVK